MSTAVDTNVLVDFLAGEPAAARRARQALERAHARGGLVIAPVVYAELLAYPGRRAAEVDAILQATGITVDWDLSPLIWRRAGEAFAAYAERRRKETGTGPRRILADFLIGAHAAQVGALLTRDLGHYRTSFPELQLLAPEAEEHESDGVG